MGRFDGHAVALDIIHACAIVCVHRPLLAFILALVPARALDRFLAELFGAGVDAWLKCEHDNIQRWMSEQRSKCRYERIAVGAMAGIWKDSWYYEGL